MENPSGIMLPEVQKLDEKIGKAGLINQVEYGNEQQQSDQFQIRNEIGTVQTSEAAQLDGKLDQVFGYADRSRINVKGFEQSGVMSNDDVHSYLNNNLPPEHISGERITEINYPNQYHGDNDSATLGVCSTDTTTGISRIEIFNQTSDGSKNLDDMQWTITHEVGHNVYWNLSPEQCGNWSSLSASSRPDEFVSTYARTSGTEDFAESYAAYVRDPELLQDASQGKFNFMRNFVFSGRQYA